MQKNTLLEHIKSLIPLWILLSAINISFGQRVEPSFGNIGATWYYQQHSFSCASSYIRLTIDHDTIINGQEALYATAFVNDDAFPEEENFIFKSENKKVFFYEDDEFKLLYDFGLRTGDTMEFHIPRNRFLLDFSCSKDSFGLDNPYFVQIENVDTLMVNNVLLRRLATTPLPNDSNTCFELGTIVQLMGSLNGLFGYHCDQCLSGCIGHFRCYMDESMEFILSNEECDFVTSVGYVDPNNGISVFPNPFLDFVTIETDQTNYRDASFTLINVHGNSVPFPSMKDLSKLDLSHLPSGIYFLVAESKERTGVAKLLKR